MTHKARLLSGVVIAAMLTIGGAVALETTAPFPRASTSDNAS